MSNQRGGAGVTWARPQENLSLGVLQTLSINDKQGEPLPKGYMISDFSLFSRKDGISTLEHVDRFTMQCEELANYENFYHFKLRLFPNSLIRVAFTWYTTLLRNFIRSSQEMKRQFHTQFFRAEPKVCIADLSRET